MRVKCARKGRGGVGVGVRGRVGEEEPGSEG